MSRRDVDAIIAAANPVREADIGKPALQEAERKLDDAIARERNAAVYGEPAKRARRRGPGLMVTIFATLVLAGGALAATGVWDPFGGDQHDARPQSQPAGGSRLQPGLGENEDPEPTHQPRDGRLPPTALGQGDGTVASPPILSPVAPEGVEEPVPDIGDPGGQPSLEEGDPTTPGTGGVGGGQQPGPKGQPGGKPDAGPPPVQPPPSATRGFDFFIKSGETRQAASVGPFSLEAFCEIQPELLNFGGLVLTSSVPGATVSVPGLETQPLFSGLTVFAVGQKPIPVGGSVEPISATGGPVRAAAPDGTAVVAQNLFGAVSQSGHPGECNFSGELIQTNQENQ